ncbi:MAG: dienelactone hydrolase family protein [Prevotella sp.]|nr:dienelactone hydrolase family protein [Prevotella sp.]
MTAIFVVLVIGRLTAIEAAFNSAVQDDAGGLSEKMLKTAEGINLKYWLYTPKNPAPNMPLILYLHGGSGKGNDLDLVVQGSFPKFLKDGELGDIPSYVIMPQLPSNYNRWTDIKEAIKDLIVNAENVYNINPNKISITGHSMGGRGTYDIALAYPDLFSCAAPMSGRVLTNKANIEKLKNIPIWAFVGLKDTISDPKSSIDFINSLKKVNDKAKLTAFDGAGHFEIPELGYKNTDVINWLISNSKTIWN